MLSLEGIIQPPLLLDKDLTDLEVGGSRLSRDDLGTEHIVLLVSSTLRGECAGSGQNGGDQRGKVGGTEFVEIALERDHGLGSSRLLGELFIQLSGPMDA